MESPCNNVCTIDRSSGYCAGCGRTLAEIAEWTDMGADRRQAILALLPARMKVLAAEPKSCSAQREPDCFNPDPAS